jgi:Family of unknown function (DUF6518)
MLRARRLLLSAIPQHEEHAVVTFSRPPARARITLTTRLSAVIAIGVAIGVATSFMQASLSTPWAALANSASPWLAAGFACGAVQSRRGTAIAAGLSACVLEVLAYYVASMSRGFPASQAYIVFWTVCALVGGPLFGLAGWAWRRGTGRSRIIGAAFLPGTFIAEAVGAYLLVLVAWQVRRLELLAWTGAVTAVGLVAFGPLLEAIAGGTVGA